MGGSLLRAVMGRGAVPTRLLGATLLLLCLWMGGSPLALVSQAAPGSLADLERGRVSGWERDLVVPVVAEAFRDIPPADREQAVREVLACFHVVFHVKGGHRFDRNVAVMGRWRHEIDATCARYVVPPVMAHAILTWENSGSERATSWAACTGMGQLSRGAMSRAHRYGDQLSARGDGLLGLLCQWGGGVASRVVGRPHGVVDALEYLGRRLRVPRAGQETGARHERLRKAAGLPDERTVPTCNVEDAVLFMRYLLDLYGDRVDLAVSAYHNGVQNTDDLLLDWLKRHAREPVTLKGGDRTALLEALGRYNVTYLRLWNDERSRCMLNGLFTMDGVPTTAANAREALGDESDLYPWKTLGAAAGLGATPEQLASLMERYRAPQDEAEAKGFVPGPGGLRNVPGGIRVTPEVLAWVRSVRARFKSRTGKDCPIRIVRRHDTPTHQQGLAVDVLPGHPVARRILKEDWLFDRIFLRPLGRDALHVCLNPRFASSWERSAPGAEAGGSPPGP